MTRAVLGASLLLFASIVSASDKSAADATGTTIVGERESAVGLYLAPWQDEASNDLDRPPARFDLPLATLDAKAFRRVVDYREQMNAYRRERLFRSR